MIRKLTLIVLVLICTMSPAVDRAIIFEGAELIGVEGPAAPSAARHPEHLSELIFQHQTEIVNIFNEVFNEDPSITGRLVVMFTLEADGRVSGCVATENETGSQELADRICEMIEGWWLTSCWEEAYQSWVTVSVPY